MSEIVPRFSPPFFNFKYPKIPTPTEEADGGGGTVDRAE